MKKLIAAMAATMILALGCAGMNLGKSQLRADYVKVENDKATVNVLKEDIQWVIDMESPDSNLDVITIVTDYDSSILAYHVITPTTETSDSQEVCGWLAVTDIDKAMTPEYETVSIRGGGYIECSSLYKVLKDRGYEK